MEVASREKDHQTLQGRVLPAKMKDRVLDGAHRRDIGRPLCDGIEAVTCALLQANPRVINFKIISYLKVVALGLICTPARETASSAARSERRDQSEDPLML